MSDHATIATDRFANRHVDLGFRLFLTGFFLPFAVGPAVGMIGYGMTGSTWILLAVVFNTLFLLTAANYLYGGSRKTELSILGIGVLFLILAATTFLLDQSGASCHLAFQFLIPALFAATLTIPVVRIFLGSQRGEAPPVVAEGDSPDILQSIFRAEGTSIALRDDAKTSALTLATRLRLAALLLFVCGVGGLAIAVPSLLSNGAGLTTLAIASLLCFPPIFVLKTLGDNWSFLANTKGYEKNHVSQIVANSNNLSNCVLGSIVVLAILAIVELSIR